MWPIMYVGIVAKPTHAVNIQSTNDPSFGNRNTYWYFRVSCFEEVSYTM